MFDCSTSPPRRVERIRRGAARLVAIRLVAPDAMADNDGLSEETGTDPGGSMHAMLAERPALDYVALDLETTGLLAETDRIVEVGAVRFDAAGVELGRFERLV